MLVSNNCGANECEFILKRREVGKSQTHGSGYASERGGSSRTTTYSLSFSSRLFGRVTRAESGAVVELIGVPVVNGTQSCPPLLEQQGKCKPEPFYVQGGETPAQSFRGRWGVDISGQAEAEMITGIFAELQ